MSADHLAIMKNEGELYEGLEKWDYDERVKDFKQRIKPGTIKARTNRGIRLGMTEPQVRRILGRPTKAIWSKKFNARELIYARVEKFTPKPKEEGLGDGMSWHNYYLFRNGRLFYIEFSQDVEGGA